MSKTSDATAPDGVVYGSRPINRRRRRTRKELDALQDALFDQSGSPAICKNRSVMR
jgi:hypothetical protein